ncbi:exonuclease domain-containing protein [Streptomyces sp. NBC_00425]|uniref:exonuclease domain-containing protein n=1 Tax=Streptomyces sp. NBC_00425 TaxID=2975740 RepID=UPI002E1C05C9
MKAFTWTRRPLIGFDLETTGVDVETARIVTAAVVRWGGGMPTEAQNWISDLDGAEIPAAAADIHGYSTQRARLEGRPAGEVVAEITAALAELTKGGWPVVAMCAQFDLTILWRECVRYGVLPLWERVTPVVLDPRVLDKEVDQFRKGSRRLVDLCHHYGVKLEGGAHNSEVDAKAACGVVWKIGQRHQRIGQADIGRLHANQVDWAQKQDESFREYQARTYGQVDDSPFGWPLIPAPSGAGS